MKRDSGNSCLINLLKLHAKITWLNTFYNLSSVYDNPPNAVYIVDSQKLWKNEQN
ncbi:hypothetical protein BaLi_c20640 [Bacillus paralicheniformis ATCC 9945a]|nr:hypothetical protein BaLi_c20640 [Bacillus paralicheniformis ATCC 9945a]